MSALLAAILFVSAFSDVSSCTVQGHVSREHEADGLLFSRADQCEGIRHEQDYDSLVIYSPYIWVLVLVPAEAGHRRFMYRWGAQFASVGTIPVPIVWGYVGKG